MISMLVWVMLFVLSLALSKQVATERARVEVARAVETTVNSALMITCQPLEWGMIFLILNSLNLFLNHC